MTGMATHGSARATIAPPLAGSCRRTFLKVMGMAMAPAWATLRASPTPPPTETPTSDWLTPVERFFVRSHLGTPSINRDEWRLAVDGNVRRPRDWTWAQIREMEQESHTVTVECAENLPGGSLVGNAQWRGVPLARLLEEAGVKDDAQEVVLEGADRGLDELEMVPLTYARSLPLEEAVAAGTLIALEMNGQPLIPEHGHPARAIVPGWYGMAHVKWLTRVRVSAEPFRGFYMAKRYFTARRHPNTGEPVLTPVTRMGIKSQIDSPIDGETLSPGSHVVRGLAWAGCRTVERVEVSSDGGRSWTRAELQDTPKPCAWVRWSHDWEPSRTGPYALQVRAFDDQGESQPLQEDLGRINRYDNRWVHTVRCTVKHQNQAHGTGLQGARRWT